MLTSCTLTCPSPVVTVPPWLPPVSIEPLVELVMPPLGGGGVGKGGGLGRGAGTVTTVRPVVPRSRNVTSAYADAAKMPASNNTNVIPATALIVFVICWFPKNYS